MTARAKTNRYSLFLEFLLGFFIFFIPSNLFYAFRIPEAYVHGLLVDYLLPKIYAVDGIGLILIGTIVWKLYKEQLWKMTAESFKNWLISSKLRTILLLVLIARQFFSPVPVASLWFVSSLLTPLIALWFTVTFNKQIRPSMVKASIALTILFQAGVATYQWLTEQSVAGYLFFGEPNLSRSIGLAKTTLGGVERVLPYGTTAHPNVLAGVLVLLWWMFVRFSKRVDAWTIGLGAVVLGVGLITQSVSALLMLTLIVGYLASKKIQKAIQTHPTKVSALLIVGILVIAPIVIGWGARQLPETESFTRRATLNRAAVSLTIQNPLFGTGLNAFTTQVEKTMERKEIVRFIQPVHNVGWLWMAEAGVVGVLLAIVMYRGAPKKTRGTLTIFLVLAFPVLVLDHYLMTLMAGRVIMLMFIQNET